jgi:hypothetical protein
MLSESSAMSDGDFQFDVDSPARRVTDDAILHLMRIVDASLRSDILVM